MRLSGEEAELARGGAGEAAAMALRIVAEVGRVFGAERLIPIASAHIDGCLYHGDSGVEFAERLVAGGGRVRVPATLNVGALDFFANDVLVVGADDGRREVIEHRDPPVKFGQHRSRVEIE